MKGRKPPIGSLRIKSFKAIQDTGVLKPGTLTAFIVDNGTGKSRVLEALRFLRTSSIGTLALARRSLSAAPNPWSSRTPRYFSQPSRVLLAWSMVSVEPNWRPIMPIS